MVDEQEDNQRGGSGDWSRASKKPKLPKAPPQRGLGVAQLEKILRDQQQNTIIEDTENKAALGGRPSSYITCSLPHPHHSPLAPLPPVTMLPRMTPVNNLWSTNSITRHVPSLQNFDHFSPMTSLTASYSINSFSSGGGGGVYEIGGSAVTLPGHGDFPIRWNFTREIPKLDSGFQFPNYFLDRMDPNWPSSPLLQGKHFQFPSPMMNVSMSTVISSASSSGLNHHIEPPSNQRSDNYNSTWSEEEKMVGIKRQWPFAIDDQPCFPNIHKPSSFGSRSGISFEPSKAISRDEKKGGQSKLNPKKGFTDCTTLDANFLTLGLPATSSQSTQTSNKEVSEFDSLQFQGSIDDPHQWSGQGGSSHQKPFYSFLPPKEQVGTAETTSSLDNRRGEAGEDSVDLNLKLSLGSSNKD